MEENATSFVLHKMIHFKSHISSLRDNDKDDHKRATNAEGRRESGMVYHDYQSEKRSGYFPPNPNDVIAQYVGEKAYLSWPTNDYAPNGKVKIVFISVERRGFRE